MIIFEEVKAVMPRRLRKTVKLFRFMMAQLRLLRMMTSMKARHLTMPTFGLAYITKLFIVEIVTQ